MTRKLLSLVLPALFTLMATTSRLCANTSQDAPVFPETWHVFLDVPKGYVPTASELTSIPESLGGKTPILRKISNKKLDLLKDFGGVAAAERCAWLYAEMESSEDREYALGCGADWWFEFFVNGKSVCSTFPAGNGLHPPKASDHIFPVKLRKGKNLLAVKYVTGDSLNLIAMGGERELSTVDDEASARLLYYTSRGVSLKVDSVVPRNLNEKIAKGLAPQGYVINYDWGKLMRPRITHAIAARLEGPSRGSACFLGIDIKDGVVLARIQGTPALTPEDELHVLVSTKKDEELSGGVWSLRDLNATFAQDGTVTVAIPGMLDFEYGAPFVGELRLGLCRREDSVVKYPIKLAGKILPGAKHDLHIEKTPAGPTALLDGEPFFYNCLNVHPLFPGRSIPSGLEGPDCPFNVVATRLGGNAASSNWWFGPGQYDFTLVDWQLNALVRDYPNAKIALFVWCHPGNWYSAMYPERLSVDDQGDATANYYVSKVSFSNPLVRQDAEKALEALVRHCEKYFGSRIVLYNLMGGSTCEWINWNGGGDRYSDFSAENLAQFRKYAEAHGMSAESVHIPTAAERERTDDELFRNPRQDMLSILYDRFYSQATAEFIDGLAGTVKRVTKGKRLVGAYYAYQSEFSGQGHPVNNGGHNALRMLLASPNIDFFLSPQSYYIRALGSPNADMKPYGAIRLAGKFSIMEDDTRTHLLDQCGYSQALTLWQTQQMIRRNIGTYLCHRMPLTQLNEHGGDEWNDPALKETFARALEAGKFVMADTATPDPTRIAAVIDEKSLAFLTSRRKSVSVADEDSCNYTYDGKLDLTPYRSMLPLTGEQYGYQRARLQHIGAPVDWIQLEDVAKTAGKYDVVIFLNCYGDTPELREAFRALRGKGCAIVVDYGAGFLGSEGLDLKPMEELLGMKFQKDSGSLRVKIAEDGRLVGGDYPVNTRFVPVPDDTCRVLGNYAADGSPAVVEKDSVLFYGGASLDEKTIRELARSRGVHIYTETDDNLQAGARCISIHARFRGPKTIKLPAKYDVVEVFSGETVATGADSFTVEMQANESKLFLLK